MSFSNIEVDYSNDLMSLHVMIDLQFPNNAGGIAALNSPGKSLTQEQLLLLLLLFYYYFFIIIIIIIFFFFKCPWY